MATISELKPGSVIITSEGRRVVSYVIDSNETGADAVIVCEPTPRYGSSVFALEDVLELEP